MLKKKIFYAAATAVSAILLCNACSNSTQNDINDKTNLPETELITEENSPADTGSDTENTDQSANITIEMQNTEDVETAEDGTILYTSSCTYPTVAIEDNESAADKINADIQAKVEAFKSATRTSVRDDARETYQYLEEDDNGYFFTTYEENLGFELVRCDTNVISFKANYYTFSGGAHGNSSLTGINYSTQTGELIDFADLSEDAAKFYEDTLVYNQELAATDAYKNQTYNGEPVSNEDLKAVLYAEDKWYLSTSGLVFISDPYALGPYAAGAIEFVIPYYDLDKMGLKAEYDYPGKLTKKLYHKEIYSMDINGDGKKDTFQFYTESQDNEDGTFESTVHFVINEKDFLQGADDEMYRMLSDYVWPDYGLYDLDPTDDTIEFVFFSGSYENDEYVIFSHFYRYGKEGDLTYLGRINGDINDPMADTSKLTR